jgi:hypothetical protein
VGSLRILRIDNKVWEYFGLKRAIDNILLEGNRIPHGRRANNHTFIKNMQPKDVLPPKGPFLPSKVRN